MPGGKGRGDSASISAVRTDLTDQIDRLLNAGSDGFIPQPAFELSRWRGGRCA